MRNWDEFERRVGQMVARFFAQKNSAPPADRELARFTAQLRQVVMQHGLPAPLAPHESGEPGGMSDDECAPLVAEVAAGLAPPLFTEVARQLVKACFYPEFKKCRDSFREVAPDGSCRRQELERARGRISGSHCVDCPHWVALAPAQHAKYLAREWCGDSANLVAHREIFLPEDFRALRQWLYAAARETAG